MLLGRPLLGGALRTAALGGRHAEMRLQIRVRRSCLREGFAREGSVLDVRATVKSALVAIGVHDKRLGLRTERPAKGFNGAPGTVAAHR